MTILREDFAIELMGLYEDQLASLDGNTKEYRKVYFWRNMVRTLFEIRSVLLRLNELSEFRENLDTKSRKRRQEFRDLFKEFEQKHELLKRLRNDIGGHVQHEQVAAALNGMQPDRWGFLELGPTLNKTHYRFAGEILVEMQIAGLDDIERQPEIERQIRETAELIPVFALMELVFATYVDARKLHL
jgi:hypothetical protein